jgi:hypothetical protein
MTDVFSFAVSGTATRPHALSSAGTLPPFSASFVITLQA